MTSPDYDWICTHFAQIIAVAAAWSLGLAEIKTWSEAGSAQLIMGLGALYHHHELFMDQAESKFLYFIGHGFNLSSQ